MRAEFLDETADGRATQVALSGEICLPPLNQNRRTPRVRAQGCCQVFVDGATFAAELVDASREGLGLRSPNPPDAGRRMVVELPDGRRLAGAVVRSDGGRIGARLEKRLAVTDPLLSRA